MSGASHHPDLSLTVPEKHAFEQVEEQACEAGNAEFYLVLGNLVLPRPPEELKDRTEKWEPHLAKLNARNMEGNVALSRVILRGVIF